MTKKKSKETANVAPLDVKPPKKSESVETLFVRSKGDRFRRCGREFNKNGEGFALDSFSKDELAILESEPQLICQRKTEKSAE